MNETTIQLIMQGGGVGIAVLLVGVVYKIVSNLIHHSNQVIKDNSAAHQSHAVMMQKLCDTIDCLKESINRRF